MPVGVLDFFQENKRSSVATVPGTSIRLAVFRGPNYPSEPDTLVRVMPDGTYRYFSDTSSIFLMPNDLQQDQIVVAGGWIYFTAYADFLWRFDPDVLTSARPVLHEKGTLTLYPNPSAGRTLSYKGDKGLQDVQIIDTQGKVIWRKKILLPGEQINLSAQRSGVYAIRGDAAGNIRAFRIVLE